MNRGVGYLLLFSLLTGMGGYFAKLTAGISSQQILFARAVLACLFMGVFAIITRKTRELKLKFPGATLLMGAVEGLSIYFYYLALETTTITNTTLLVYTAPVWSVLLAALFLGERVEKRTVWGILASLAGVVVVSDMSKLSVDPVNMKGSVYALLAGFFYSAMAISSKRVAEKTTPLYAAFWQYLVIIFMSLPFALPLTVPQLTSNMPSLLYLGWAAGGVAFILYMEGIARVKGQVIQVITMLEILVASLSGILLLGEGVTVQTIIGASLILAGISIVSGKK